MNRAKPEYLLKPKLLAVSVAACFAFNSGPLRANPSGPTVVSGGVGFSGLGTSALTITNQAGGNAVINWNGFSIGINELTRFQQFANLAVLNRVTGSQLSSILGSLQSDGRVFLINPNGIVFGASARIDVAGLVASSLNLSDQDFLSNRLHFTEVPGAGAVVNNGIIQTATGGRVYLVAPTVENNGLIQSPQGAIVLAAGKEVELVDADAPFVTVKVAAAEQAVNVGDLVAAGGKIGMYGALVRNSGVVEAGGAIAGPGGEIRLVATRDLTLDAGSTVSANGTSGGQVLLQAAGGTNLVAGTVEAKGSSGQGGTVQALGVRVGVVGHGVIDASGDTGGGTVLVGGDAHGANAAVQNAESTQIGSDGVIRADAMRAGDGGRVIVWADGNTTASGSISARGGSQSGNGGFVETSGKQTLSVAGGRVDTRAPAGTAGGWLLDPADFIVDGAQAAVIELNFSSNGSVTVAADNDINFLSSLNLSYGAFTGSFTAYAGNNINFNTFGIAGGGNYGANVNLAANSALAYGGASGIGQITSSAGGGNITTLGGSLSATGAVVTLGNINTGASGLVSTPGGGGVSMTASGGAISTGSITTGGGYIDLSANGAYGAVNVGGPINTSNVYGYIGDSSNGGVNISATGDITTSSITTKSLHPGHGYGGDVVLVTDAGRISVNGTIDARGASGVNDGNFYYAGTSGGSVALGRLAPDGFAGQAVSVAGSILATGGNGLTASSSFSADQSGGSGGSVSIGSNCDGAWCYSTLAGNVSVTGSIDVSGGNGGSTNNPGNDVNGRDAGSMSVLSYGSIAIGAIGARGGNAGSGGDGAYGSNYGGWGGSVTLNGGGSVSVGPIDLAGGAGGAAGGSVSGQSYGGDGGYAGYMDIQGGSVTMASIAGRGGNGGTAGTAGGYSSAYGGDGGEGAYLNVNATAGALSFGPVDVSGGQGGAGGVATDYAWGGSGGDAGSVNFTGASVSLASMVGVGGNGANGGTATGGSLPDAHGGSGGDGASSYVSVTGAATIGPVNISGGNGGKGGTGDETALGGSGGSGGYLDIYADTIGVGPVTGRSGNGGQGGTGNNASGGDAGNYGASIYLRATGAIVAGTIDLAAGNGASGGAGALYASGGSSYYGGSVTMNGSSITTGSILTAGGNGGAGGTITDGDGNSSGGWGGWGGYVQLAAYASQPLALDQLQLKEVSFEQIAPSFSLSAGGPLTTGPINASGGDGGNTGATGSSFNQGGAGGGGPYYNGVSLYGSTINVNGPILAKGGNGGSVLNASLPPSQAPGTPTAGDGGSGGSVYVYGTDLVKINVGGSLGAMAINVSGGIGGAGNAAASPAGNGGAGGSGGSANVAGSPNMTLFGSVLAGGGGGGAGGAGNATNIGGNGGAGGGSGSIFLDASSLTGTSTGDGIIFVLAGTQFNVQGGLGGSGGGNGGAGAGTAGVSGSTGSFLPLSDYFGTILILDPLSVPEINAGYQQIAKGGSDSTTFVGGEKKDEEEDKSQKELGSCKG